MRYFMGFLGLFILPLAISVGIVLGARAEHWSRARWDSSGLSPDPAAHSAAVVQVFAARTWGWKGALAVHSWISFKPEGASGYDRYDVVGWGVGRGAPAVRRNLRPPDGRWAGNEPVLVAELKGGAAAAAIPKLEDAIARYPFRDRYLTWPGPNSNTFVAWLAREVPELRVKLPGNAIGKDFLPGGQLVAAAPSGTGFQLSFAGLLGVMLAKAEGLELNLLGLVIGLDPSGPALKLPGIGRLGFS